jgi:glycosyltransferase involved in cell wall biosynthesis
LKKFVHLVFIFSEWDIDPRKHLYREVILKSGEWSDFVIVQHAIGLIGHFLTRFKQKILGLISGKYKTRTVENGVVIFTPVILFHYGFWLKNNVFSKIDLLLIKYQLNKLIARNFPDSKVVLWMHLPFMYALVEKIRHDYLVYDLQDNIDYNAKGIETPTLGMFARSLIRRSNLVICTSSILYNSAVKINPYSILINNGNEFKTLSIQIHEEKITEISTINKKIIGYLGGIRDWLDFELINYIIQNLPHVCFVFIGILYKNSRKEFSEILKYDNVLWVKYKEQTELPYYLRKFSAGIIPFKINEYNKAVFPNKFFEYMACEVPIITTSLPDLQRFSDIVGYSNNKEQFLNYCTEALNGSFSEKIKSYSQIAFENSWEKRAEKIDKALKEIIGLN